MPFPISKLLDGSTALVTALLDMPLDEALELMVSSDFSQLPVVDDQGRLLGIVDADAIVRFLSLTNTTTGGVSVRDVKRRAETCEEEDELSDVVRRLSQSGSLVVVDGKEKAIGIVTDYDTGLYYKRRAEDILLVEDIELMLREMVMAAFPGSEDIAANPELLKAVLQATVPHIDEGQFCKAIESYRRQSGGDDAPVISAALKVAYAVLLEKQRKPASPSDLTFAELKALFLQRSRWHHYKTIISLDKRALDTMLTRVGAIRNTLAHFKRDVTPAEHDGLVQCQNWLTNHRQSVLDLFAKLHKTQEDKAQILPEDVRQPLASSRRSRYSGITDWLTSLANWYPTMDPFIVNISDVEGVIGAPLPEFARTHVSWWANDSVSHPQSKAWLSAGWRVKFADLQNGLLQFEKVVEPMQTRSKNNEGFMVFEPILPMPSTTPSET